MSDEPLAGNPWAQHAAWGDATAQALLALAHEVRTLAMIQHPYYDHNTTKERMTDSSE